MNFPMTIRRIVQREQLFLTIRFPENRIGTAGGSLHKFVVSSHIILQTQELTFLFSKSVPKKISIDGNGEIIMSKYMKYMTVKGQLDDEEITAMLRKLADDYENGEIIEVRDELLDIVYAINMFDKLKGD